VRGGLDDALDRLARMDQLRRRAEGASGGLPTAHGLAEAIEAVRRVVERHPDLNVTLYGEQGEGSAEVRIGWEDCVVRAKIVSVEGPEASSFGPGDGPPLPVLPAEIPPISDLPRPLTVDAHQGGRHSGPPPVPEMPRLVDPGRLADRRRHRAAADTGFLPDPGGLAPAAPPPPPPPPPPPASDLPPRPAPPAGDLPMRSAPRAWKAEHDDNAAARLAAMIREDPSLLAGPEER
jgi:hypothetical protein